MAADPTSKARDSPPAVTGRFRAGLSARLLLLTVLFVLLAEILIAFTRVANF